MITIGECLKIMHSGAAFSLTVVAYDRRRKDKTGQLREYKEAVLMWADAPGDSPSRTAKQGERAPTVLELRMSGAMDNRRKPRHSEHYTRNIRLLLNSQPTESIVKIHPPLIIKFNGETTCP